MTPQTPHTMGSQSAFQVAPFVADVTPRLGDTLVFGLDADSTVAVIEHPLLAKGVVLRDAGGTYVLCALDWCTLGNDAYDLFRARIARAAGTSPSHVAVHTVAGYPQSRGSWGITASSNGSMMPCAVGGRPLRGASARRLVKSTSRS